MVNEIAIVLMLLTIIIHVALSIYIKRGERKIMKMIHESKQRDIEFWKKLAEMMNNEILHHDTDTPDARL